MKIQLFIVLMSLGTIFAKAQPLPPYEIDESFKPTLSFLQKIWTGEYDGLEPNSKKILTISRSLILYADMTYSNEIQGRIEKDSSAIILKHEEGCYTYDSESAKIIYQVETDSTLDINIYLQSLDSSYLVNHYIDTESTETYSEQVQFTKSETDNDRQWVFFDSQLMSPIDTKKKAVYVLTSQEHVVDGIKAPSPLDKGSNFYDLNGRRTAPKRGVFLFQGKKIIIK